jgi:hypothetical protein
MAMAAMTAALQKNRAGNFRKQQVGILLQEGKKVFKV